MNRRNVWVLIPILFMLCTAAGFTQNAATGKAQTVQKTYDVTIRSNVRGATITIDGVVQKETTPAVITLTGGIHVFSVSAPGYETFEQRVTVASVFNLNANLTPAREAQKAQSPGKAVQPAQPSQPTAHRIVIQSNVQNAQVAVNGLLQGNTPVSLTLSPGKYMLRVTAPGFQEYETTITVNKPDTITAYLQPENHMLVVNTNVNGAKVFLNGALAGTGPLQIAVAAGNYTVKVTAPEFQDFETTVNVNRDTTIPVSLVPFTYLLGVSSNVNGAQVYLDGNLMGTAPFRISLQRGTYSVKVTAQGYLDYLATIEVKGETQLAAQLLPAFATISIDIPTPFLDQSIKDWTRMIQVSVDGKNQVGRSFQVTPGKHVIRFATGVLAFEQELTFESGETYTLQPFLNMIIR